MNPYFRALAPAIVMACGSAAGADAAAGVQAVNARALAAMEAGKWEEALGLFESCIAEHGENAMARFGPSFGVTWYRKGICEMQLKRPEAAAKSFEICYRDFPNRGKGTDNIFNKRALLRWAEAAQATGQHAEAIRLFKKFLEERDKAKDPFDPGSYYIQLALCHLATGDVVQGAENLETAVRNRKGFKTPPSGIVAALQALVSAAIAGKDETTLAAFLEENREDLAMAPAEAAEYLPTYMRMGADAMAAGMDRAAPLLFELPPSTGAIAAALKADAAAAEDPASKADLQARAEALEKAAADGTGHEALRLEALAVVRERQGKLREASAAYGELVTRFPRAKKREEHLFHLVRTTAAAGEPAAAAEHGPRFLEDYPDSPRAPEVRRLMLLALFQAGNHQACTEIAAELLPKLPEGSQDHDACLHILGASLQQTGRPADAAPLLERHAALYPQSRFAQASLYFLAANRIRLEQWDEGAKLLDAFIAKYPQPGENPYLSLALLDRALCHAAKGEDAAALEKLGRLGKEFAETAAAGPAQALKGDLLRRQGKAAEAEACYKQALAKAESAGDRPAVAEALARLAELLASGGKERAKEAAAYCDRFWKDYGDIASAREKMALIQPAILERAGRGEEALERLRATIAGAGESGTTPQEAAIREYARIYAAKHGLEALDKHFRDFPGIPAEDKRTRCLLLAAVAGVAEESLGRGDRAAEAKADALLRSLYQDLKSGFAPEDLPSGMLLRTGDFLRTKTSAPRQALPYYEEALRRGEEGLRFAALLGKATVLAEGGKEERESAIKDLETVFAESPAKEEKEDALYWLVMIKMKAGDFAGAGHDAERYLAHDSGFRRHVPELRLALGGSYQARNMTSEALAAHERVWREHQELPRVSNPAMRAWMQLSWARGNPAAGEGGRSDRQAAYEEGRAFLERTRPLYEAMEPFDQEIWLEIEKLVKEYGKSTDVRRIAAGPAPGP